MNDNAKARQTIEVAFDKPSKRTRYHKNNIAAQGERGMESGQKEANGNKEATDVAVN